MTEQSLNKETQNGKGNLIRMEFDGVLVTFHGKKEVSLTDLWKAAGSPELKDPNRWLNTAEAAELMCHLLMQQANFKSTAQTLLNEKPFGRSEKGNLEKWCQEVFKSTAEGGLVFTKKGRYGGGTWANQIIAVSYAGYLSPKLQIWVNQVFLDRLQEEQNPDLIAERFIATHARRGFDSKWINARFKSIQSNKEHNEVLNRHGVEGPGFAMCAHNINVGILGTTKKKYLTNRGIDPTENIRDHMSEAELVAETLAELLSDSKIEKDNIIGNKPCAKTCHMVAKELSETVHRLVN